MPNKQTVFIIDDDEGIRDGLALLLESIDLQSRSFDSGLTFLKAFNQQMSGCIVLDIYMPKMTGLQLLNRLKDLKCSLPIIFITGHCDIPMAIKAMHLGAFDFFRKPFNEKDFIDRISEAFELDAKQHDKTYNNLNDKNNIASLSGNEWQVFEKVTQGGINKAIAADLGVSEHAVAMHYSQMKEKLGAKSLAQLVRIKLNYEALA